MVHFSSFLLLSTASAYTFTPTTVTWHGGVYTISEPTTLHWTSENVHALEFTYTSSIETTGENVYTLPGKISSGEEVLYTSK